MLKNYINDLKTTKENIKTIISDIKEANETILNIIKDFNNKDKLLEAKNIIKNISSRANNIDNKIVLIMAKFSPEAKDLREMIAYLKLTTVLARISTNTKNLIKGLIELEDKNIFNHIKSFYIPMQEEVIKSLTYLLEMIDNESSDEINDLYNQIIISENKLDDYYEVLQEEIFKLAGNDLNKYKQYQKLLSSLKKLEKIGDRILIAASLILFAKIGGELNIYVS